MSGLARNCNTHKNRETVEQYITMFNPYEDAPSIGIDLVALTRYAKEKGKAIADLSMQEIEQFKKK